MNTPVYLIVISNSDPSVGIFESRVKVETPFWLEDINSGEESPEDLELFRERILDIYKEFEYVGAIYDFEIKKEIEKETNEYLKWRKQYETK